MMATLDRRQRLLRRPVFALVAAALLPLSLLAVPAVFGQAPDVEQRATYTWVDENGQRVFSDRPPPGENAQRLEITVPARPSDPFAGVRERQDSQDRAASEAQEPAAEPLTLRVVRPTPEETYVNTGFRVQAGVRVEPRMPPGARVVLYLDGALAATGQPGQQSFLLEDVYRGEHRLAAAVVSETGEELARTSPVTFFVRQASVLSPP